ncbi:LamG domain-containing protein, partial [Candidatus Gracilibacteria bacterium]|nr:LamG domain-containing protein [Candidatus Gracilibacteria bacterium]
NGKYYQLYSELENTISYKNKLQIIPISYANSNLKIPVIKGNYNLDPSLPSLLITDSTKSIATSSGIFDPNICFVLNNSTTNYLSSSSGTCTPKKNLNLKDFDNSLVGYWGMETICESGNCGSGNDGKLKDLSGNGNDGVFSGGMVYTSALTGGIIGKGLYFNNTSYKIEIIDNGTGSTLDLTNYVTFEGIINAFQLDNVSPRILNKDNAYMFIYENEPPNYDNCFYAYISPTSIYKQCSKNNSLSTNKYYYVAITLNNTTLKVFINGIQSAQKNIINTGIYQNDYPLYIGNNPINIRAFNGIIDDIKIYNRTLSDDEIREHAKIAGF